MRPYREKILSETEKVRRFDGSVSEADLEWHRDLQDRVVEVINGNGWMLQMDNQVPTEMVSGKSYFVESKCWHRIIKGNGDLVLKITESKSKEDQNESAFVLAADKARDVGKKEFEFPKGSGKMHPVTIKADIDVDENTVYEEELRESLAALLEKKKKRKKSKKRKKRKAPSKDRKNPRQYDAPQGSERDKGLDAAAAAYAAGDVKKAARIRDRMEKKARSKKGFKSKPRKDTGKYTESTVLESKEQVSTLINDIYEEIKLDMVLEELEARVDEKRKRKKKSGKSPKGLSKAVKKSLDKKADKRCLTRGSVYAEFRKGLSAYLSSGSRKGMTAHQWAHARVNSANPSKKWATVKKRKKCPKKKKK